VVADRLVAVVERPLKGFLFISCTLIHSVYFYVHGAWKAASASGFLAGYRRSHQDQIILICCVFSQCMMEFLGFFQLFFIIQIRYSHVRFGKVSRPLAQSGSSTPCRT
jgi:hypothetical protein